MTSTLQHPRSLRTILSFTTAVVAILASFAAASLTISTTVLRETTGDVAASVESVRLAGEAEVALLLHARARDQVVKRQFETIKYSPAEPQIQLKLERRAGVAVFEVRDRGIGIPREDHRGIFEPFHRAGAKEAVIGAGLGLFNVRRIIDAHDGRIEVESVPSSGSTFRIHLPLARARANRSRHQPEAAWRS